MEEKVEKREFMRDRDKREQEKIFPGTQKQPDLFVELGGKIPKKVCSCDDGRYNRDISFSDSDL